MWSGDRTPGHMLEGRGPHQGRGAAEDGSDTIEPHQPGDGGLRRPYCARDPLNDGVEGATPPPHSLRAAARDGQTPT